VHWYLVGVAVVLWVLIAAAGVVALWTGRVLPRWVGRRILRPRLWGTGAIVTALGMAVPSLYPVAHSDAAIDAVFVTGTSLFLGGLACQMLAQRPGHDRRPGQRAA
jgi:predicted phage tail protein